MGSIGLMKTSSVSVCVGAVTCEQRRGLLYDESVWLSEEQVSLQEKSLKGCQSPVEEHQVGSWQTGGGGSMSTNTGSE